MKVVEDENMGDRGIIGDFAAAFGAGPVLEPICDGVGLWRVTTQNSTYLVLRRADGTNAVCREQGRFEPTPRVGVDMEWKDAEAVYGHRGGMLIIWEGVRCSLTSVVEDVEAIG